MKQVCPKCRCQFVEIMPNFYTLNMAIDGKLPELRYRCVNCNTIWKTWACFCSE